MVRILDRLRHGPTSRGENRVDLDGANDVQMDALRGLSYSEGRAALKPNNSVNGQDVQMHSDGTSHEHSANPEAQVSGPIGRIFNSILGVEETRTDTALMAFDVDQMRHFLDEKLMLCRGEYFRSTKLSRVAKALMEKLDTNQDGLVGWGEFQGFQEEVLKNIAPGVGNQSSSADVTKAAQSQYSKLNTETSNSPQSITFDELQGGIEKELPEGTANIGIISQLAARIAMYAVDKDQGGMPLKERSVSESEWSSAALDIHKNGKNNSR